MEKIFLVLKGIDGKSDVGANAFSVIRCEPINDGKNTKLTLKGGHTVLAHESPAEILNIYLSWTSRLTDDDIEKIKDR